MKQTLLEIDQDILSSMDSDEINSISDTVESLQVVKIIKTVYNDIISRGGSQFHRTPFTLTASGDITKPTLMTKPDGIINIDWVKYNTRQVSDTDPVWADIEFVPIEEFMIRTHQLNPSEAYVSSFTELVNGYSVVFNFRNDTAPCYYTSYDDNNLVFDAHDSVVDTTLQTSKTMCFGARDLTFVEADTFVPELPADQFSLLLNEAKSLAWAELKQVPHAKAESTAKKNWSHLAKTRRHIPTGKFGSHAHPKDLSPYFGRK